MLAGAVDAAALGDEGAGLAAGGGTVDGGVTGGDAVVSGGGAIELVEPRIGGRSGGSSAAAAGTKAVTASVTLNTATAAATHRMRPDRVTAFLTVRNAAFSEMPLGTNIVDPPV
ncbi:MAG TPA: hypothetical protein VE074_00275 [Jatrophihabitantaceae bacterium]|nr:hypothetical protein [Jatrophihabitantaceae bacterium]